MGDVFDNSILLLESIVHLLGDVALILLELVQSVLLDPLNLGSLPVQLRFKLIDKFTLHLLPLILLLENRILNLFSISCQVVQDSPLVGDTLVTFIVEVFVVDVDLIVDGRQLIIEVLNTISSLLSTHIVQGFQTIIASLNLVGLVLRLFFEGVIEILMQAFQLLFKFDLICFQTFIHLLSFIHCILFDVLNLSILNLNY